MRVLVNDEEINPVIEEHCLDVITQFHRQRFSQELSDALRSAQPYANIA
jgi:hypothetical protein